MVSLEDDDDPFASLQKLLASPPKAKMKTKGSQQKSSYTKYKNDEAQQRQKPDEFNDGEVSNKHRSKNDGQHIVAGLAKKVIHDALSGGERERDYHQRSQHREEFQRGGEKRKRRLWSAASPPRNRNHQNHQNHHDHTSQKYPHQDDIDVAMPTPNHQRGERIRKKKENNGSTRRKSSTGLDKSHFSSASHNNDRNKNTENPSSKSVVAPSIVGIRPLGWNRPNIGGGLALRASQSSKQKKQQNSHRLMTKAGALTAATRIPLASKRNSSTIGTATDCSTAHKLWDGKSPLSTKTMQQQETPSTNHHNHKTPNPSKEISFTPAFLPSSVTAGSSSSQRNQTTASSAIDLGDDIEQAAVKTARTSRIGYASNNNYDETSQRHSHDQASTSPLLSNNKRKKRRSHTKMGPLSHRFANMMKVRSNDLVRLQSPAFSRHNSLDLNNPRKRARSYTDITILGGGSDTGGGGSGKDDGTKKRIVLAYAHRHVLREQNSYTISENLTTEKEQLLVWACFDLSTVRAIGGGGSSLRNGTHLRLYNAKFIPTQQGVRIDPNCISPPIPDTLCRYYVVCTSLSEFYPKELEPLPESP